MSVAFPRVYRSFEEFERHELSKLDSLYASVDKLVDEMLSEELADACRDDGRRDAGPLFDNIEEIN